MAVTAYGGVTERIRILSAGFDAYVAKPVEPEELAAVIGRLSSFAPPARCGSERPSLRRALLVLRRPGGTPMRRYIDLSVTVDDTTLSPPSTNMRLEVTPHRRGPGFWQVSSVHQSLHTGAHIDSPLHVFKDGITTAEIALDQVMGEAIVVDLSFVDANHKITIDDLKRGGADQVKPGDIVLLRTDWTDRMYGALARLLHPVAVLSAGVGGVAGGQGPQEHRLRLLRGVLRAPARLLVGGLSNAPDDPGRRRRHHGRAHQPVRAAARGASTSPHRSTRSRAPRAPRRGSSRLWTERAVMEHLALALAVLVAIGSTGSPGLAAQTDAWLEGYAAAVLERELRADRAARCAPRSGVIR